MKYIIQIIGGLGLLLMLNMCVQAGMLSHADIQNKKDSAGSSSQADSSDPDAPKGFLEIRERKQPQTMSDKDPAPEDYSREAGGED